MMFLYAEHYAGKGPNEVISCLDHGISTLTNDKKIKDICWQLFLPEQNISWHTSTLWFIKTLRKSKFCILFQAIADYPAIATLLTLKKIKEERIEL